MCIGIKKLESMDYFGQIVIFKRSNAEYERIVQKLGEVVQGERCKSYLNTALFYDLQILKYRSNR